LISAETPRKKRTQNSKDLIVTTHCVSFLSLGVGFKKTDRETGEIDREDLSNRKAHK